MRLLIQPYIEVSDEDESLCGPGCPYRSRSPGYCYLDPRTPGLFAGEILEIRPLKDDPSRGHLVRSDYCLERVKR